MKKILLLSSILTHFSFTLLAQVPPTTSSADIYMQLKKLNVLGSILYVAAHPDDENNGLLPYLAKEKLYRTAYLSLTRGDGGQNLIGSEQGIELGMIRTQELLAARRIDGAEQYFSRAYEFGFSKSSAEALRIWDKEKILSDVVWVIRKYQPDVIIKRFPPDARAGHGHHAASAIIADEAYIAAADPNKFPEQFKNGVRPWKAKRIIWNTFNFGGNNTTSNDQLKIDVGGFNSLIGKSYGELGGEARSMHKSQGEGRPRRRGQIVEYFSTTGGDAPKTDLMDSIDITWNRVSWGDKIEPMVKDIIAKYNFEKPELSVPALVELYKSIARLPQEQWKAKKLAEVQELIENCAGIFADAITAQPSGVEGDSVKVSCFVNKRSNGEVKLENISIAYQFDNLLVTQTNTPIGQSLLTNQNYNSVYSVLLEDASATQPYWLRKSQQTDGSFEVTNPSIIGDAWSKPVLNASFRVKISDYVFFIKKPVQYKYTDAAKGELYQPFVIIPKLLLYVTPHVPLLNVVPSDRKEKHDSVLHVICKSNVTLKNIPVTLYVLQDSVKTVFKERVQDFEKDKMYTFDVPVAKFYNKTKGKYLEAAIKIRVDGREEMFTQFIRTIQYDHIPDINFFFKDHAKFVTEEIKTIGKKIGYIPGAGDKVPEALIQMGYDVKTLTEVDLTEDNLKQFDAVITGVRAYNIYEYLTNKNDVLMNYVKNGGSLIAQYVKSNQVGSKSIRVGPYPFIVSPGSRVTEELATVNYLLPQHSLLNYPNKITDKDFEGWVQERSTYQAEQVDSRYEALLGMNDTNEKQSSGSLITTKFGNGYFTYVSLVLFRQLPAGVPGSYRLLANLIAQGKVK